MIEFIRFFLVIVLPFGLITYIVQRDYLTIHRANQRPSDPNTLRDAVMDYQAVRQIALLRSKGLTPPSKGI